MPNFTAGSRLTADDLNKLPVAIGGVESLIAVANIAPATAPWGGVMHQGTRTVTFPAGTFTSAPAVHVSPVTSVLAERNVIASVNNVTASGFDILVARQTNTATTVHWHAIAI